jgi:pentatricopeptide repeat protein
LSIRRRQDAGKPSNSIIKAVKSVPDGAVELPDGITKAQLRRLKLEVPWLGGDKVKVLRRTKELLKDQRQAEALQLVRLASKEQQCTIAWNAILEELLERKRVNEAFKVYNDVRLFKGCLGCG